MTEAEKHREKDKDKLKEELKASTAEFTKLIEERIEFIEKSQKAIDGLIAAGAIKDNFIREVLSLLSQMFSTDTTTLYRTTTSHREMLQDNANLMDRVISLLEKLSTKVNEELSEEVNSIKQEVKEQREKVESTLEPIRQKIKEDMERQERNREIYG
jgi:1-aminocyclopropane-1-carboxylate deaminase/D-cysteine desulfhydrase-like pyridoxal-dependent ACC family enzyme